MDASFAYDVFLSHSSRDKTVVRELAERLRKDGLRVWFDDWEVRPGDSIPAKIEEGLESSRLLLFCMSGNAFGSDWATLESQTFRFRDPLNKDRRFIPLRLDDTQPKGSLVQFSYVDWRVDNREFQYERLLQACHHSDGAGPTSQAPTAQPEGNDHFLLLGHTDRIRSVAFSPDGRFALSGSHDHTLRLWDVKTGSCLRVLEGHANNVLSVTWSPDGRFALSGSQDGTLRLWDVNIGTGLRIFRGHASGVLSVAWSPKGQLALSSSEDGALWLWDVDSGHCLKILEGHANSILSVSWSPDARFALSGSADNTLRLWDITSGRCVRILKGHNNSVTSVAWRPDGRFALSGSIDSTLRLWDMSSGRCLRVLNGHSNGIWGVAWSPDGRSVLSCSDDFTLRLWDVDNGRCLRVLSGHMGTVFSVACSPTGQLALSGSDDDTLRLWEINSGRCLRVLEGHTNSVLSTAWSPAGKFALSGSDDDTVRLWELTSGRCLRIFRGHTNSVTSLAWNPVGRLALSGSDDFTLRLWEIDSGRCLRNLEGHTNRVTCVAWSPDGRLAISGSSDGTLRLWEPNSDRCLLVLKGHTNRVSSVTWSRNGRIAISGSHDRTLRVWDVSAGTCLRILKGHVNSISSVACSPADRLALSGSDDFTLRLWEIDTGRCIHILEGHTDRISSVAWNPDGKLALSGSSDHTLRLWNMGNGECVRILKGHTRSVLSAAWGSEGRHAYSVAVNGVMRLWELRENTITDKVARAVKAGPQATTADVTLQYTNAKVLLVGESGAGKTGLSMRLAHDHWKESGSTVGAWATQWKLPVATTAGVEREIWLWDFGGQSDQRLIHQLYMDETALAVLVFDPQKEDVFDTLGQWDRDLTRAARRPFQKLLAAGRIDTGGLRVSRSKIEAFTNDRSYSDYLETSAKTGDGCDSLKEAILKSIRWEDIPWRSSPRLFKLMKEAIVKLKDEGRVLMRLNELRETLQLKLGPLGEQFTDEQLKAVVNLLAGPGIVWELAFGSWVLLQPELINAYAQAVIRALRADEHQLGCILEERALRGELAYATSMLRLPEDEERIVLLAMHQTLVERGLCLRDHDPHAKRPTLLVFPSYYGRERPDLVGHPAVFVSYRFNGFLDDIYATLVVRLHHTQPFEHDELWRYAADFKTALGKRLGVKLTRHAEGAGELEVYFDPAVSADDKVVFSKYVHEHLLQKAQDVERLRHYVCPHCGTPVGNRDVAMKRLADGRQDILCVSCEQRVPLWDELEERFASPEIQAKVRDLQEQAKILLDKESKERALVGDIISTVALAGQISRELPVSTHGIDMEIEFRSDAGHPTGRKLLLQLRSSIAEGLAPPDADHVSYWMSQAFPVLGVVRNTDGEIRWMDLRHWQKHATNLSLERFDVMSVRRWRDRVLGSGITPAGG